MNGSLPKSFAEYVFVAADGVAGAGCANALFAIASKPTITETAKRIELAP
jgi:hypothetical protein